MIGKLYNGLALFSIATVLALGGFGIYLVLSSQLDTARAGTIAAVLRGEYDEQGEEVATSQPAEGEEEETESAVASGPGGLRVGVAEEVRAARRRDHIRGQMLERAARDVEARQRLLDQALQDLIEKEEQLTQQRNDWTERKQELSSSVQDEGFTRELDLVSGLPPRQAKAHLIETWNKSRADAVRMLLRLDVGKAKRILSQFKTPEEEKIMSQLLEQMRTQGLQSDAGESGTADGQASP